MSLIWGKWRERPPGTYELWWPFSLAVIDGALPAAGHVANLEQKTSACRRIDHAVEGVESLQLWRLKVPGGTVVEAGGGDSRVMELDGQWRAAHHCQHRTRTSTPHISTYGSSRLSRIKAL